MATSPFEDGPLDISPSPSPEEAAAIVAAIQQSLRGQSAPEAPADQPVDPWFRTARVEAVSGRARRPAASSTGDPWIARNRLHR